MDKNLIYHLVCGLTGIVSIGILMVILLNTNCVLLEALCALSMAAVSCLVTRVHEMLDEADCDE